jgi:hypothetical protein
MKHMTLFLQDLIRSESGQESSKVAAIHVTTWSTVVPRPANEADGVEKVGQRR